MLAAGQGQGRACYGTFGCKATDCYVGNYDSVSTVNMKPL